MLSSLAAFGIWPALPLSGLWLFRFTLRNSWTPTLPPLTLLALMTVAGIAVWSGPMLASAAAGLYSARVFGLIGWAVTLCALTGLIKRRAASTRIEPRLSAWDWALGAGLILAAGLYLGFPNESMLGGRDQGTYANHAIFIARHGRLDVPYPWPAGLHSLFFPPFRGFPGVSGTSPNMTVHFPHLFPVWLAQAFSTFGHHGLFRLNGIFALLSAAIFCGICRFVLPNGYAVVATLFLALNPSQIWLARTTLAEMLTQLFVLAGLLALTYAMEGNNQRLARWAGVLFGISTLVRIDSFFLVPLLLLSHLACRIVEAATGRNCTSIWTPLYQTALPVFALSWAYYQFFVGPYVRELSSQVTKLEFASVISLLALAAATPRVVNHVARWLKSRVTLVLIGIALFALATYGYWIRPQLGGDHHRSLVNLSRYLSPLVIWGAILGWFVTMWLLVRKGQNVPLSIGLVIVAGFSLLYLRSPLITPDHFWAIRRFVPVVIPGFIFFAGIGVRWILERFPVRWSVATSVLVLSFLGAFTLRADAVLFTFPEYKGYFAQLRKLAAKLPKGTPILTHGHPEWATPLFLAFDRQLIPILMNSDNARKASASLIPLQLAEHEPVYLLYEGNLDLTGLQYSKVDEVNLSYSHIEQVVNPLPRRAVEKRSLINIVRITGIPGPTDYRNIVFGTERLWGVDESGFHQEGVCCSKVRWTDGAARLAIPLGGQPPPKALRIGLGSTGPKGTRLQISLNGRTLFDEHVPAGGWSNVFSLEGLRIGQTAEIELRSDSFIPEQIIKGSSDVRTLGVLVQGIWLLDKEPPFSDKPLSSNAYRSQVKLKERDTRFQVSAGQTIPLRLIVSNIGNGTWPRPTDLGYYTGGVRVGILWFARGRTDGRLAEQRAELPRAMFANDRQEVDAVLHPIGYDGRPLAPGHYDVWIGLVQEQVAWFYGKGDAVLKLAVEVRP